MRAIPFSDNDKARLRDMLRLKMNRDQIALAFGVSERTAGRRISELFRAPSPKINNGVKNPLTASDDDFVVERYSGGMSVENIALAMKRGNQTIYDAVDRLKQEGRITDRARSIHKVPIYRDITDNERASVLKAFSCGIAIEKIGRNRKISPEQVAVICDVPMPQRPHPPAIAGQLHLIDLKRGGHTAAATEVRNVPRERYVDFHPVAYPLSCVGSPAALCERE
jgi:hypothetical protein